MEAARPTKLDALTSLRFFAALLVVVLHCGQSLLPVLPELFGNLVNNGGEGVTIFFVLSGFILSFTYATQAEAKGKLNLRSFFVNRFARIYPVYLACLLLRFPWVIYMLKKGGGYSAGYLTLFFGGHLTVLQSWYPPMLNDPSWLNQSWTLTVEFFFYSAFPFLLLPLMRMPARLSIAIGIGLVVALAFVRRHYAVSLGEEMYWSWQLPPARLGEFVLGMAAGITFTKGRIKSQSTTACLWLGLAGLLGILTFRPDVTNIWHTIVTPIASAALIVGLTQVRAGLLSTPTLILLGEASYSLYLVHGIVKEVLIKITDKLQFPSMTVSIPMFITYLILAVFVSIGFYKFIEVPARKYLRAKLSPTSGLG